MDKIVIEEKKSKACLIAAAALAMFVISASLWIFGTIYRRVIYITVGILGTVFFGISLIAALVRALRSKPLLTITLDGVIDSSCAGAAGFISYLDIERFEIVNVFGQRAIGVIPRDTPSFLKKLKTTQRKNAEVSLKMNYPPIMIRVDTAKDMTIEDILSMLSKRLTDFTRLYD